MTSPSSGPDAFRPHESQTEKQADGDTPTADLETVAQERSHSLANLHNADAHYQVQAAADAEDAEEIEKKMEAAGEHTPLERATRTVNDQIVPNLPERIRKGYQFSVVLHSALKIPYLRIKGRNQHLGSFPFHQDLSGIRIDQNGTVSVEDAQKARRYIEQCVRIAERESGQN